jgi:ribosomal protein S18 acetylase RimI-like enzyme
VHADPPGLTILKELDTPMIRTATESDISSIQSLMQSVPGLWHEDWPADVLERAIRAAEGLAFVSADEGKVLGFACAHDLGFRGYLSALVVAEEARGRGIGRQLVRHVEQELAARGCAVLISDVWRGAEGFYRALGWTSPDVILLRHTLVQGRKR